MTCKFYIQFISYLFMYLGGRGLLKYFIKIVNNICKQLNINKINYLNVYNIIYRLTQIVRGVFIQTFIILHCATPVTVRGTPWAVSTFSHIGLRVITLRERRCTSVTSHQAQAHPPTIVRFLVEPQQPPGKFQKIVSLLKVILIIKLSFSERDILLENLYISV